MTNSGRIKDKRDSNIGSQVRGRQMFVSSIQMSIYGNLFDDFYELVCTLEYTMQVSATHVSGVKTGAHGRQVSVEKLAANWVITLETSKRTVQVTTQHGLMRITLKPSGNRCCLLCLRTKHLCILVHLLRHNQGYQFVFKCMIVIFYQAIHIPGMKHNVV